MGVEMSRPALSDREVSDYVLEAMCRAHDAEESAEMGEPSLWVVYDRGDFVGTGEQWSTYRAERLACMRAALFALSPAQAEREGCKRVGTFCVDCGYRRCAMLSAAPKEGE